MADKYFEMDLYPPIKKFLQRNGYDVKGEVKDCDIVAIKTITDINENESEELVIVELKKSFNISVVYQALDRQKMTNFVYIAIPRPKNMKRQSVNDMVNLVKRLGLGLMIVALNSRVKSVDILAEPEITGKNKNTKKRISIINESKNRSIDGNIGGVNKRKLNTAYRENCIHIALVLEKYGNKTVKELRKEYGTADKTSSIVNANFYNWFNRVEKGIYNITDKCKREIELLEFAEVVQYYRNILDN